MQKAVIGIVVLVLIGVGAFVLMQGDDTSTDSATSTPQSSTQTSEASTDAARQATVDKTDSQNVAVTISDYAFSPANLTVKKGTTVTWTNEDSVSHDVTPENETDDFKASDLFGKGKSYSVTFNTVGTYNYFCSPHPYMQASVTVVE